MKFQNSGMKDKYSMEDRYNDFWNSEVVSSYKLLKIHAQTQINSFFSINNSSVDRLVKKYCDGVTTIVNNLTRQMDLFEDQEYVKIYLASTKQEAITDLQELMSTCILSKENMNYINNTFVLLEGKKAESTQGVSTPTENFHLDMGMDNMDSLMTDQLYDIEQFFSGDYDSSNLSL